MKMFFMKMLLDHPSSEYILHNPTSNLIIADLFIAASKTPAAGQDFVSGGFVVQQQAITIGSQL